MQLHVTERDDIYRHSFDMCVMKAENDLKYARAIAITGDSLSQLNIRGINKQMLFDTWLLSIREEWL